MPQTGHYEWVDRNEYPSKAIHRHYIRPFPTPASREGTWVLAKAIIGESEWLSSLWAKRVRLGGTPVQILCGLKDPDFGPDKLARWQEAFPRHSTLTYPEVGHFVAEELGSAAVQPIADFLDMSDVAKPRAVETPAA